MNVLKNDNRYQVIISEKAQKKLNKLPKRDVQRIVSKFSLLAIDPFQAKKLSGELAALFSLRIWPYRVIFIINRKQRRVEIRDIGHRQGIYK